MLTDLRASYRVQLHAGFGFADAASIADYLAALGISHLYCSPYLQAAPGSTHGYDVVNHQQVNHELGGEEGHRRLCEALRSAGLGQVLDIVPNHMAITGGDNPWWWDVLENGPSSRYAAYFDVDWDPPESKLRNMVLLPVLGDHYGRVLESGELYLESREDGRFVVRYHDHAFPVSPRSLDDLLGAAARRCRSDELAFIAESFGRLPRSTATDQAAVRRRHRDKEVLRCRLMCLYGERPEVRAAVEEVVSQINRDVDQFDALLERQNYRLALWRTAGRELGYRRFFDINTLVGLLTEDERVFNDTHALILGWLATGMLDGVRVDHPDGLRDPQEYFERLRAASPRAWIVAEKILEPGERLPAWPIAGTTGYDFIYRVSHLFVDPEGEAPLTEFYADFTGAPTDFGQLVAEKKRLIVRQVLGSDLNRLTALFVDICERHRRHRDYTRHELHECLAEVIVCFPVYRTYARAEAGIISDDDAATISRSIEAAQANRPDVDPQLFQFLGDILLLRVRGDLEHQLVMRFQQLSGPVMAKGVEDTAFYCFNRLVSLNEVGGDPGWFGLSSEAFHAACIEAQACWPRSMLASSTHDTKRSEDVRARIHVLSEIPERWREAVGRWAKRNEIYRRGGLPDRNTEYLFYQTLVGAWPIELPRALAYMEKAAREAKTHTSWTDPNPDYDAALRSFVEGALSDAEFKAELETFVAPLVEPGRINSLGQTLIKLTAPGVPDFYQGSELWDLSLVDPDNRRPVDYMKRRALLSDLDCITPSEAWGRMDDGLPKLWLIRQALKLRGDRRLFAPEDSYRPLRSYGSKAEHVIAFSRGERAVTVVPRWLVKLAGNWGDTALDLPAGAWKNELSGEMVGGGDVSVADLLKRFPVALMVQEGAR